MLNMSLVVHCFQFFICLLHCIHVTNSFLRCLVLNVCFVLLISAFFFLGEIGTYGLGETFIGLHGFYNFYWQTHWGPSDQNMVKLGGTSRANLYKCGGTDM